MENISEQTREKQVQYKKLWTRKYQEGIPKKDIFKVSKSFSTKGVNKSKNTVPDLFSAGGGGF